MTTNDSKIPGAFLCLYLCSPYIQMKLASSSPLPPIIYLQNSLKQAQTLPCWESISSQNPLLEMVSLSLISVGVHSLHRFIIYFVKVLVFDSISWIFVEFQTTVPNCRESSEWHADCAFEEFSLSWLIAIWRTST